MREDGGAEQGVIGFSGRLQRAYQGRVGVVVGKVGRAFRVEFLDGNKRKQLIANPVHLAPAGPVSEAHA